MARVKDLRAQFDAASEGRSLLTLPQFEELARRRCNIPEELPLPEWLCIGKGPGEAVDFEEYVTWYAKSTYAEEVLVPDRAHREIRRLAREHGLSLPDVDRIKE